MRSPSQFIRHRWKQFVGGALIALSLGACGGLPKGSERTTSTAMKDNGRTALAAVVRPRVAAHPGLSGLHELPTGEGALAARLALADAAQRSLDVQYFIWNKDMAGKVLLEHLFRAADRGVRVRLLLDDLGTMPTDAVLLAIDSHPNIEVRMFNPVALRSPRMLGMIVDFGRINKRMHNKSFTADGQVSIVGGRNIGDEYFEANAKINYADLDVVVLGPVVKEVSDQFDLYWNNRSSIPIATLARQNTTPEQFAAKRAALTAYHETAKASAYARSLRDSEFARQLRNHSVPYYWGKATIVNDHPDKVATSADKTETHLAPQLRAVADKTKRELFLVSPYFVPGKKGVELLAGVHQRGVRVVVITNSLASTDGVPVHSKYQLYRKPLIEAGVELYEIKPTAGAQLKRRFREPAGTSTGGLHAKTFAFDRRIGFIGSYNLDPRSNKLNTEMGVLYDCPQLARRLPEQTERELTRNAYRVELDHNRLVWVTHEGDKEVRLTSEPDADLMKRIKAQVISWLPIEWLL
ncbi:MAG TPA: phospholipase D family protein [Chthoniobacteraceae bacterium]|nr:phospholipase D family protein [Chthoniobacteraceae bacterium]